MNIKLTAILLLFVVVLLHGFKDKPKSKSLSTSEIILGPKIKFRTLTSTIKSDTSAVISVLVERGEDEQELTLYCTIGGDSLRFTGVLLPNDRNITINYRTSIKLK